MRRLGLLMVLARARGSDVLGRSGKIDLIVGLSPQVPAPPLGRKDSIKVYASTGLATRIGVDAETFGIAWQHRWGGRL